MAQTVVGVFDSSDRARDVQNRVIAMGIPQENVMVHSTAAYRDSGYIRDAGHEREEGGIVGWFKSLFGANDDDEYAAQYSQAIERGRCVVTATVTSDQQAQTAIEVMHDCGAVDVEEREAGAQGTRAAPTTTGQQAQQASGTTKIPVVEEEMKVGKRAVERGVVRVFTTTSEQPVEQDVRLRRERTVVERSPADRPANENDMQAAEGRTFEVRETVEEPVVEKKARVTGEVTVGKQVEERTETVRDKVRKSDVKVEKPGSSLGSTDTSQKGRGKL